jgi:hypothetical protein
MLNSLRKGKTMAMQPTQTNRAERDIDRFFGGHQNDSPEPPMDTPTAEIIRMGNADDPEVMLAVLEKKAALAPRFKAALDFILISQTNAADWTRFGDKMCLGSAGAERVGKNFPITIFDVKWTRQDFTDTAGKGYRYVFEGKATLYGYMTYATGSYSTREDFLCKKDGAYRALEEINENDIQRAAENIMKGNSIKSILGLRGIPVEEWEQMMTRAKQNPTKAKSVEHGKGTQGGTTADDTTLQKELAEICVAIANAGYLVVSKDYKTFDLEPMSDAADTMECARLSCVCLSTFIGKDGGPVKGLGAKDLKGMRLQKTTEKAREMKKKLEALCQK